MIEAIYQKKKLKLIKANTSDTEAPFLDLNLSISKGIISYKIYDNLDDFDFALKIQLLVGDVPRAILYILLYKNGV